MDIVKHTTPLRSPEGPRPLVRLAPSCGLAGALLGAALSQAASLAWAAWRRRGASEEAMDAVYFGMHGTGPGVAFA